LKKISLSGKGIEKFLEIYAIMSFLGKIGLKDRNFGRIFPGKEGRKIILGHWRIKLPHILG